GGAAAGRGVLEAVPLGGEERELHGDEEGAERDDDDGRGRDDPGVAHRSVSSSFAGRSARVTGTSEGTCRSTSRTSTCSCLSGGGSGRARFAGSGGRSTTTAVPTSGSEPWTSMVRPATV